jgi:pimeloyl-ACP methyl ester carboxylesterase
VFPSPVLGIVLALATQGASSPPSQEEQFRVWIEPVHLQVFLRHLAPTRNGPGTGKRPVLIIHGSTLPSGTSAAFRINGVSWMDDLAARGFDVWALDFLGYGGSDRYPAMNGPAAGAPLGRSADAARQISAAVDFITRHQHVTQVDIIAHSGGSLPAGLYATQNPERLARLVMFAPVMTRDGPRDTTTMRAYGLVTAAEQVDRFSGWVPRGQAQVFDPRDLARLAEAYVATDPTSSSRSPASVRFPLGRDADAADTWAGTLPYDPVKVMAPVLIIRGEWDPITTDADAQRLFDALTSAPVKRDVKISRATHVMQFEEARGQLYAEVALFLSADLPERRTTSSASQ